VERADDGTRAIRVYVEQQDRGEFCGECARLIADEVKRQDEDEGYEQSPGEAAVPGV
jgi:hypothetical protein